MFNSKDAYAGCPNASIKTKRENEIHWFMQIECGGIVLSSFISALSHPYIHLYMQHTIALVYVHLSAVRGKGHNAKK